MQPHLRLPASPVADPANVVAGDTWRVSILDAGLVRIEHTDDGVFEDRATQVVLHRDQPPVDAEVTERDGRLLVRTSRLDLEWDRTAPWPGGLRAQVRGGVSNYRSTWRPGDEPPTLGGTARTLDGVDGRTPLEPGLLARGGITVVDDSGSLAIDVEGDLHPHAHGSTDLYLLAYGRDYEAALDAWHRLTGPQPLLPRYVLGNWWSRYHPYTADEYLGLMDRFDEEAVPLSVAVVDMDWHLVDVPAEVGSGWTGYTFDTELFPDPDAFLAGLHERDLHVTLNLHPADGVRVHEDAYESMATRMGIDPDSRLPVLFDAADQQFMDAYLEELHHPLEARGVDFWWVDWQQGPVSRTPGLDPLWLLNHVHWLDSGRDDGRELVFSRYAGLGSHRYPIGFSGDTVASWESLDFQPEFTATAANVGFGWWSHDVGGHNFGVRDDELATRWVQHGVFSPITRLHSSLDPFSRREPWAHGPAARQVMGDFLRLRHQLVPYLATMVRRAHDEHRSLVAPMYHAHPWEQEAYEVPNQHTFGSELVVVPITTPMDEAAQLGRATAWLPPGTWVDVLTGVAYAGDRTVALHRPLASIPVLARAGAVVPLVPADAVSNDVGVPDALELVVVAGADGSFTLLEDHDDDEVAATTVTWDQGRAELTVAAPTGASDVVPSDRELRVRLLGFGELAGVTATVGGGPHEATVDARDPLSGAVLVRLGEVGRQQVSLTVDGDATPTTWDRDGRLFEVLDRAQVQRGAKRRAWARLQAAQDPAAAAAQVHALDLPTVLADALAELLLA